MSMYDMYPEAETWSHTNHQVNGGLGHAGYEGLFDEVATAEEVTTEAARRRELAQRESLSPAVAQNAMYGADVQFGA